MRQIIYVYILLQQPMYLLRTGHLPAILTLNTSHFPGLCFIQRKMKLTGYMFLTPIPTTALKRVPKEFHQRLSWHYTLLISPFPTASLKNAGFLWHHTQPVCLPPLKAPFLILCMFLKLLLHFFSVWPYVQFSHQNKALWRLSISWQLSVSFKSPI